jgi:hypothetical protein
LLNYNEYLPTSVCEKDGEENTWNQERQSNIDWRKFHKEELHNLYALLNIIRMIKSWRIKWVEHVAHGREKKSIQSFGRKT